MVHWLFHAERAGIIASLAMLWPLFLGQLLVFRFTPRRKWNDMKLGLVLLGLCALTIESIRAPDMQGGFGVYSCLTQRLLYEQLGCFFLYCLVLVLLATARSLYLQMHRRLPRAFELSMWAIVGGNHVVSIVIIERSLKAWDGSGDGGRDVEGLMRWWNANLLLFQVVAMLLLCVYWILFLSLRKRVAKFLHSLEAQEAKKKDAAAVSSAQAAATAASTAAAQQVSNPAHISVRMSALELPPPAATAAAISTATGNLDPAAAAAIAGDATTPRTSVSVRVAPSAALADPSPPQHQHQNHLEVNPKRSSNSASNAAPSKVTQTRLTQVAPAPSATSAAPAAGTSQADTRLSDLRAALRKLNLLTLLVNVLLIGTSIVQLPNQIKYLSHGTIVREVVVSPSEEGAEDFPLLSGGSTGMNHVALMTILWYSWSSPRVWMSAHRRTMGIGFWNTVCHGLDENKMHAAYAVGAGGAAAVGAKVVSDKRTDSSTVAGQHPPHKQVSAKTAAGATTAQPTPQLQPQPSPASPAAVGVASIPAFVPVKTAW